MDPGNAPAILPLSADEADHCLALMAGTRPLLAVSGGVDSIALMRLAAGWAQRRDVVVSVSVVDHGLRAEAADEAAWAKAEAEKLGLPCIILRWTGQKPASGLQQAARSARYALLVEHARNIGADAIVTAHTLDDQAETVMMRLAAGSGPAGMAAMQMRARTGGMSHFRPFLAIPKERLVATCRTHGWGWVEDASNRNEAFARVRWRALMPLLAREGLTAQRLGTFARRMAETEMAMQQMTEDALALCQHRHDADGWRIDARALFAHPDVLVVRVIVALLQGEAESGHGLRLMRLEACVKAMRAAMGADAALTRTLAGHVLSLKRSGTLVCRPEPLRHRGCVNPVRRQSLGNGPTGN
jgi:tRNA(Ile)-lysidine synthase